MTLRDDPLNRLLVESGVPDYYVEHYKPLVQSIVDEFFAHPGPDYDVIRPLGGMPTSDVVELASIFEHLAKGCDYNLRVRLRQAEHGARRG